MATLSEKFANLTPKTRQYIMLGGAGAALMGLIVGGVSLMDNQAASAPPATTNPQASTTSIATPGSPVDPKDVWIEQSATQMRQMDDVIHVLKQQMNELSEAEKQKKEEAANGNSQQSILPPLPPIQPPPQQLSPPVPIPSAAEQEPQAPGEPGIASFEVSQSASQEEQPNTQTGYVPAGSFVRAALLGGLDAPTGGQAQTNPHPILMRTQDNAFLPNRYRFEIKECFLLASSYGDISSERAFGRLENLSCVKRDGGAIDIPVKGYVVGEDGKAGMRGRLISKQGQVLANALLAGIGSGIGKAFQANSLTQSISPLGTTNTVTAGQALQNGIGTGVGDALDRLSKYYIDLAEKLFPVIEIDAGRTIEVVFTKGFSLEGMGTANDNSYSDIWRRGRQAEKKTVDDSEN